MRYFIPIVGITLGAIVLVCSVIFSVVVINEYSTIANSPLNKIHSGEVIHYYGTVRVEFASAYTTVYVEDDGYRVAIVTPDTVVSMDGVDWFYNPRHRMHVAKATVNGIEYRIGYDMRDEYGSKSPLLYITSSN